MTNVVVVHAFFSSVPVEQVFSSLTLTHSLTHSRTHSLTLHSPPLTHTPLTHSLTHTHTLTTLSTHTHTLAVTRTVAHSLNTHSRTRGHSHTVAHPLPRHSMLRQCWVVMLAPQRFVLSLHCRDSRSMCSLDPSRRAVCLKHCLSH